MATDPNEVRNLLTRLRAAGLTKGSPTKQTEDANSSPKKKEGGRMDGDVQAAGGGEEKATSSTRHAMTNEERGWSFDKHMTQLKEVHEPPDTGMNDEGAETEELLAVARKSGGGGGASFMEDVESDILESIEQNQTSDTSHVDISSPSYFQDVPDTLVAEICSTSSSSHHNKQQTQPTHKPSASATSAKALLVGSSFHDDMPSSSHHKKQERLPLVANSSNKDKRKSHTLRHRRQPTVEDALDGLASAMSAMHGGDSSMDKEEYSGVTLSSSQSLAANAIRLMKKKSERRLIPAKSTATTTTTTAAAAASGGGRWDLLRSNLTAVRDAEKESLPGPTTTAGPTTPGLNKKPSVIKDGSADEEEEVNAGEGPNTSFGTAEENDSDIEAQKEKEKDDELESTTSYTGSGTAAGSSSNRPSSGRNGKRNIAKRAADKFKDDIEMWGTFFQPRQETVWKYIKYVILYVIVPLLGVASVLFYVLHNPIQGIAKDGAKGNMPSIAWWCLFVIRLIVTFSLALGMQGFVIDFLALGSRAMLQVVGPIVTLWVVQSKGWPFICFWWGMFNFALLYGKGRFAHHWGAYQDWIRLFNAENPSGTLVESDIYRRILTIFVVVSLLVAVKRFVVGIYLGRQTFKHFGEELANVMKKMLLVSEIASLAKNIEKSRINVSSNGNFLSPSSDSGLDLFGMDGELSDDEENKDVSRDTDSTSVYNGSFRSSEIEKTMRLLEHWEEPDRESTNQEEISSISAVLKFRKALTLIHRRYPFSYAFGLAETREDCVESAQEVYERLLLQNPSKPVLHFETLVLAALNNDGESVNEQKAKDIIKILRPDRQGNLTKLDWTKSIDNIYKEFRLLTASIDNSSQIDRAFENIINIVFYAIVITVTMSQLGFNPLSLFLSLSSIILAFAFAIGSASASYFEGLLFILVRRPYNIGDLIHVSHVEKDTSLNGAPCWVVEHVTLFETTARWGPTNERCSLSNGSLASSRIINWSRSKQAQFRLVCKVPIKAPYEKIVLLKDAIEEFMRARPREWLRLKGFRANQIEIEKGFIEYVVIIQHRDAWNNVGQIMDSKANLSSFILEVSQQLGLNYQAPPVPVDLNYQQLHGSTSSLMPSPASSTPSLSAMGHASNEMHSTRDDVDGNVTTSLSTQDFLSIANKHNIRLN